MNHMRWPTFLFWNALGGITWAASIALSVYFLGGLAEHAHRRSSGRSPRGSSSWRCVGVLALPAQAPARARGPHHELGHRRRVDGRRLAGDRRQQRIRRGRPELRVVDAHRGQRRRRRAPPAASRRSRSPRRPRHARARARAPPPTTARASASLAQTIAVGPSPAAAARPPDRRRPARPAQLQAAPPHRRAPGAARARTCSTAGAPAEEADPLVAEPDQVLDRRRHPLVVARLDPRERARPAARPASTTGTPASSSSAKRGSSTSTSVSRKPSTRPPRRAARRPAARPTPRPGRAAAAARSPRPPACARCRQEAHEERVDLELRPPRASTSPIARVRASVSARALADGRQPSSRAAARMRSRVPEETPGRSLTANDTAAADTPARARHVGDRRSAAGRCESGVRDETGTLLAHRLPTTDPRVAETRSTASEGRVASCGACERSGGESSWHCWCCPAPRRPQRRLSTSDRLKDRREVAAGTRAYSIGFEDGRFYANGWHITGEMGGVWAPPLKLADGVWFGVDDQWVGPATTLHQRPGLHALRAEADERAAAAPHRLRPGRPPRGALRARAGQPDDRRQDRDGQGRRPLRAARRLSVVGQHDHPTAADNLQDSAAFRDGALVFTDTGSLPGAEAHDYTALVGSTRTPEGADLGPGFRGPQPGTVCKDGDKVAPSACDDGPHGKGTGGAAALQRHGARQGPRGGLDRGRGLRRRHDRRARADDGAARPGRPAGDEDRRRAQRLAAHSVVDLPGDRTLQNAVEWGKQNLADLTQSAANLKIRFVDQGKAYPAPVTEITRATFIGAGYPDYPWLFATDGEYTAFAAVALGQFETIRAHLIALRDVSDALNDEVRQGRARDRHRRLRLLRRQHRRRQHRRVGQVRLGRRAGLALDGRQPLPRRPLRLLRAQPALRDGEARRRQGRLARGPRQRRARRAWARRSSTTPST